MTNKTTNKQNNNYYVFSQATLDIAITEWTEKAIEEDSNNEELYFITAAAIPWFLKQFNHDSSVYMFTHSDFLLEMDNWKSDQLNDYPHQKKRIENTCKQILNFFESDAVINHKMSIKA